MDFFISFKQLTPCQKNVPFYTKYNCVFILFCNWIMHWHKLIFLGTLVQLVLLGSFYLSLYAKNSTLKCQVRI